MKTSLQERDEYRSGNIDRVRVMCIDIHREVVYQDQDMIINEVTPKRDYKKFPFIHNAKVLWINGSYIERVPEMYDKSYALCRKFVKDHKRDSQYAKGKLVAVSMLEEQYKRY